VRRGEATRPHRWLKDLETKVVRAMAAYEAMQGLRKSGFVPDAVIAHPGWGEGLFVKQVWPSARLGLYCEFYYRAEGADCGFDPEFGPLSSEEGCRLTLRNANINIQLAETSAAIAPTAWQADGFPALYRPLISVIHDGIDTGVVCPRPGLRVALPSGVLGLAEEVVTFVNRNLEPYRGYHIFMRSLPRLLRHRPNLHVLIVGGDGVSYGGQPPAGTSWKDLYAQEVRQVMTDSEWARVHFLGNLPYEQYLGVLQASTVHVYLTYPFVLGWSALEAMSAGCAVVASDTPPVREVIRDGETGRLIPFFEHEALAAEVLRLLDAPEERNFLGRNARASVVRDYDLYGVCLPRQVTWAESLADK
jgi:glycosyltransferase involved in cell wall biosynthesis